MRKVSFYLRPQRRERPSGTMSAGADALVVARAVDQTLVPGRVGEGRARVQDVVADEPHARLEPAAKHPRRRRAKDVLQRRQRGLGGGIVLPLYAHGPRGVAHVEEAAGIDGKHRTRLRRALDAAALDARRNGHGIIRHQRAYVLRIQVAQLDVGDLVVEQIVLAARFRAFDAVQQYAAHRALARVVVAVGVPLDAAIGVRDEFAAGAALGDRERRNAVAVGEVVGIEVAQAELQTEPARDLLVRIAPRRAGVDRHVAAPTALE